MTKGSNRPWRRMFGAVVLLSLLMLACSHDPTSPPPTAPSDTPPEDLYRTVLFSPDVLVRAHQSIANTVTVIEGVDDAALSDKAHWKDGSRTGDGWDYDGDFYMDYNTPRSCCYRVVYTVALATALRVAKKPLIVYGLRCNRDGSITWRIIIGASVLRNLPGATTFLRTQARMQYQG